MDRSESSEPNDHPKEFWSDWFQDATFTADWASRAFSVWDKCLCGLRDKPLDILEIGSWEGRSTLFFLNFFPLSRITCLDIFMLGNEGLFDANVMRRYSHRVRKITSRSISVLDGFATREKRHGCPLSAAQQAR